MTIVYLNEKEFNICCLDFGFVNKNVRYVNSKQTSLCLSEATLQSLSMFEELSAWFMSCLCKS